MARESVENRIGANIAVEDRGYIDAEGNASSCHIWQAYIDKYGYGCVKVDGAKLLVHRVTFAMYVGELVDGMHVDHLCRNRACCNPAHLEQVTPEENTRRGVSAKLDVSQAAMIKAQLMTGDAISTIARRFSVSRTAIASIRDGKTWVNVAPFFG